MFKYDLIGINFDDNIDEYDVEVGMVILRLVLCFLVEDVVCVLYEEFIVWFGVEIVGEVMVYYVLVNEIW